MHPLLNIAVRAARRAGSVIGRHMDRLDGLEVAVKGFRELVTEVDRQAEQAIMETVHRAYPSHAFLGEESGASGDSEYVWVVDPLDGTTNFVHGFPMFSVSIAVRFRDRLEHAVVYDPVRQELFTASRGQGAQLNDRRMRVSRVRSLDLALLGTGFPYRDLRHLETYLAIFRDLVTRVAGIRRAGSAALDLSYVAAGRLDGFWEFGLKEWDVAAGALLVREAGGFVSDAAGGDRYLETGNVVAGTDRVFAALSETVRAHLPPELLGA